VARKKLVVAKTRQQIPVEPEQAVRPLEVMLVAQRLLRY
jgi:hypothetical protein